MRPLRYVRYTAAAAVLVGTGVFSTLPVAHADPAYSSSFAGVGADSSQDVADALAGGPVNGATYSAISSLADSGSKTISSFDAIAPGTGTAAQPGAIVTKPGGPLFDRPDGSGQGQDALSHAIDPNAANNGWEASGAQTSFTGKAVNVAGQIDFARDLGAPKVSGTTLDFIPYVQDAIGYAYISTNGDLASLTTAQLTGIYNGSITTVGTTTVKPCIPSFGSGVRSFFLKTLGVSDSGSGDAIDTRAKAAGCDSVEQNGFDAGLTSAGNGVVVPFATASWIAQENGVAPNQLAGASAAGFKLGSPNGVAPVSGTAPNLTPNTTFYAGVFGTPIYFVVPDAKINDNSSSQNAALVQLFYADPNGDPVTGNPFTPAICTTAAQNLARSFGFELLSSISGAPSCGSIAATGGLYEASSNT